MVLKKLLSKKKDSVKYFLEVQVKDEAPEKEENSVIEQVETTTNEEGDIVKKLSRPAPSSLKDDTPEWVKAIKDYSNQGTNGDTANEDVTFAGKYITNNVPQARRRPGPSLKPFKTIASQMNK